MSISGSDTLVYRRLTIFDRQACLDHFMRLSPESRRMRFMHAISNESLERYVEKTFSPIALARQESILVGAFKGSSLVGLGELKSGETTEMAFSVDADWRKQGVARNIFERIALLARNRGFTRVRINCLPENAAMREIARTNGFSLSFNGEDLEAVITLDAPSPTSIVEECAREWCSLLKAHGSRGFDYVRGSRAA